MVNAERWLATENRAERTGSKGQGCPGNPRLHGRQDGKETEVSSYFEVDDAKREGGQYDIKLDKDFKMIAMTRD